MLVKPAPGLRIRDCARRDFLPEEGREVESYDPYWAALIRDGDVVQSAVPISAEAALAEKTE